MLKMTKTIRKRKRSIRLNLSRKDIRRKNHTNSG